MFKKNGKVKIIIISVKILQSSLKIKMFIFNMSLVGTGEGFQGSNPQSCSVHPWSWILLNGVVRL
jgi:hypothetical protein